MGQALTELMGQWGPVISGGGGALVIYAIISFVKWAYEKVTKKNKQTWKQAEAIRNELQDSRDYWKQEAQNRQEECQAIQRKNEALEQLVDQLERRNNDLEQQVKELKRQNDILERQLEQVAHERDQARQHLEATREFFEDKVGERPPQPSTIIEEFLNGEFVENPPPPPPTGTDGMTNVDLDNIEDDSDDDQ